MKGLGLPSMAAKKPSKPKGEPAAESPPAKTGRPSIHTPELVDEIIDRLSKGEPLAQICRDEHMPSRGSFYAWGKEDAALSERFARAREEGFDAIALQALEIADDGQRDYAETEDGREIVNHDHIQRAKLRVETRLKLLAKWDPKRYGDRQQIEHSGEMGIKHSGLSDADRVAEIQRLQSDPDVLAALKPTG